MQYLLLIYANENNWGNLTETEQSTIHRDYAAFAAHVRSQGKQLLGHQLYPSSAATTVRIRDGKRLVTDGPFAETKEQLGGLYIVEAEDLDEAMEMAARLPTARSGSIEVRPIVVR